jgi:hypothetical protein
MEKFTPEQFKNHETRVFSDAKLLREGAKYVQDVKTETNELSEPRLEVSQDTLASMNILEKLYQNYNEEELAFFFNRGASKTSITTKEYGVLHFQLSLGGDFFGVADNGRTIPLNKLSNNDQVRIVEYFEEKLAEIPQRIQNIKLEEGRKEKNRHMC